MKSGGTWESGMKSGEAGDTSIVRVAPEASTISWTNAPRSLWMASGMCRGGVKSSFCVTMKDDGSERRPRARAARVAEPRSPAGEAASARPVASPGPAPAGDTRPAVRSRRAKSTRSASSDRSMAGSVSRSRTAIEPESAAPSIVTPQRGTSRTPPDRLHEPATGTFRSVGSPSAPRAEPSPASAGSRTACAVRSRSKPIGPADVVSASEPRTIPPSRRGRSNRRTSSSSSIGRSVASIVHTLSWSGPVVRLRISPDRGSTSMARVSSRNRPLTSQAVNSAATVNPAGPTSATSFTVSRPGHQASTVPALRRKPPLPSSATPLRRSGGQRPMRTASIRATRPWRAAPASILARMARASGSRTASAPRARAATAARAARSARRLRRVGHSRVDEGCHRGAPGALPPASPAAEKSGTDAPTRAYWYPIGVADGRGQVGCLAGNAGSDGADDARHHGPAARLRDRPAHRADQRAAPAGQLRDALPHAPQARAGGLHRPRVGNVGQQPARQVLPSHARRWAPAGAPGARVGAGHRDHGALPGAREGERMRTLRAWIVRLGDLFRARARERDIDEEIESHVAMHVEDGVRRGLSPDEARRQAILDLGGIQQTRERMRDRNGFPALEAIGQDARHGLRLMRKNPGFSLVAILTLALGIGANTAIFSVVNGVLLRPLPYGDPERIVQVWHVPPPHSFPGLTRFSVSAGNYLSWHERSRSFHSMAAYGYGMYTFNSGDRPVPVQAARIAPDFFAVLGIQPMLGRVFTAEEDAPGHGKVVILGHE